MRKLKDKAERVYGIRRMNLLDHAIEHQVSKNIHVSFSFNLIDHKHKSLKYNWRKANYFLFQKLFIHLN